METNRLKKRNIDQIFKQGKTVKKDLLILKTLSNNLNISRFAFIISKKVSKKAVVRNKIRRRIREISRDNVNVKKGVDYLFIVIPGLEKKEFVELKDIVDKLLKENV